MHEATVLFNREYCHLSLFYLTFTLFFASYCKTFLDGTLRLFKWKEKPTLSSPFPDANVCRYCVFPLDEAYGSVVFSLMLAI